jgi:hypothetical protein
VRVAGCELRVACCEVRVAGCVVRVVGCEFRGTGLWTSSRAHRAWSFEGGSPFSDNGSLSFGIWLRIKRGRLIDLTDLLDFRIRLPFSVK